MQKFMLVKVRKQLLCSSNVWIWSRAEEHWPYRQDEELRAELLPLHIWMESAAVTRSGSSRMFWGTPRTSWRNYLSHQAWENLRVLQEDAREQNIWATRQLPPWPRPKQAAEDRCVGVVYLPGWCLKMPHPGYLAIWGGQKGFPYPNHTYIHMSYNRIWSWPRSELAITFFKILINVY